MFRQHYLRTRGIAEVFTWMIAWLMIFAILTSIATILVPVYGLTQEEEVRVESQEFNIENSVAIKFAYSYYARFSVPDVVASDNVMSAHVSLEGGTLDVIVKILPGIPILGGHQEHFTIELPIGSTARHELFWGALKFEISLAIKSIVDFGSGSISEVYDQTGTKPFHIHLTSPSTEIKFLFVPVLRLKIEILGKSFTKDFELGNPKLVLSVTYHECTFSVSSPHPATFKIDDFTSTISPIESLKLFVRSGPHIISIKDIIEVSPHERIAFKRWTGDLSSDSTSLEIFIDKPINLIAEYKRQFLVTVTPQDLVEGGGWYDEGATVTLRAKEVIERSPGVREIFSEWRGDATGTQTPISLLVTKPLFIEAVYRRQYFVSVSPEDYVEGGGWYDEGSTARLKAKKVVEKGIWLWDYFKTWSGDITDTNEEVIIKVTKPISAMAVYEERPSPFLITLVVSIIGLAAVILFTISYSRKRLRCPVCGAISSSRAARFCRKCGAQLKKKTHLGVRASMDTSHAIFVRCPRCGLENSPGAIYCRNCGTKLRP